MSAFYLGLLDSQVDGAALLGAAVKGQGGFFHTRVSILLSGPFIMMEVTSSGSNKGRGHLTQIQTHTDTGLYHCNNSQRIEQ